MPQREDGMVQPGTGGMSVTPDDARNLPRHRRPVELGGAGKDPVFAIEAADLGERLLFRPDPDNPNEHGFVEPAAEVGVEPYQNALCDTGPRWTRRP